MPHIIRNIMKSLKICNHTTAINIESKLYLPPKFHVIKRDAL